MNEDSMKQEIHLSASQVCKDLGLNFNHFNQMLWNGFIKASKKSGYGRWYIPLSEVERIKEMLHGDGIEILSDNAIQNNSTSVKEEWKVLPDFDNYAISSWGNFKCLREHDENGKIIPQGIIEPFRNGNDAQCVSLFKHDHYSKWPIAYLVAKSFVPNFHPKSFHVIIHKDRVLTNNKASNLMWFYRYAKPDDFKPLYQLDTHHIIVKTWQHAIECYSFYGKEKAKEIRRSALQYPASSIACGFFWRFATYKLLKLKANGQLEHQH